MIIKRCPVCNFKKKQSIRFKDLRDNFGFVKGFFNIKECGNCNCLYLSNPLDKKRICQAYPKIYHCYHEKESLSQKIKRITVKKECGRLLKIIKIKRKLKILEVGAGTGLYSKYFKKRGHEVFAIDISKDVLDNLKKFGIKTIKGNFENIKLKEKNFDVIIMSHVLEHFYNPVGIFNKLLGALKSRGLVYIKTPNADTLLLSRYSTVLDVPRHIVIFSEKSVKELIKKKFKIIKIENEITTNELINYLYIKYRKKIFSYKNLLLIILFLPIAGVLSLMNKSSRINLIIRKL